MNIDLDLQVSEQISEQEVKTLNYPGIHKMTSWISLAMDKEAQYKQQELPKSIELTIRIVNSTEMQQLNRDYRNIDKPTNILSFPFETPNFIPLNLLGDLVICYSIIESEAIEQHKSSQSHWAHIIIHGVLHLLGYDHIQELQAQEMEGLEIDIMRKLGFDNPY